MSSLEKKQDVIRRISGAPNSFNAWLCDELVLFLLEAKREAALFLQEGGAKSPSGAMLHPFAAAIAKRLIAEMNIAPFASSIYEDDPVFDVILSDGLIRSEEMNRFFHLVRVFLYWHRAYKRIEDAKKKIAHRPPEES